MSAVIVASASSSQYAGTSCNTTSHASHGTVPFLPRASGEFLFPPNEVTHAQIRQWSSICAACAMFGESLAAAILFLTWSGNLDIQQDIGDDVCRWGISLSTLASVAALWNYYFLWWDEAWSRKYGSSARTVVPHCRLLHSSLRIKIALLLETVLLLVHPPPLLHLSTAAVCDLCMLMSFRFWFLARALRDTNPEHVAAVKQRRFLGPHGSHHQIPWAFAMRATFARKPWEFLLWLIGIGYVVFSIFLWVAERHEQPEEFNLFDCFWFAMVSMTTVGYGDRSPHTSLGKIIALGGCIFGINSIALLVNVVTKYFTLDHREHYLIQTIEMSKATSAERNAAASIIQFKWRTSRARSGPRNSSRLTKCLALCCRTYYEVRTSIFGSSLVHDFRRWRRERQRLSEQLHASDFQRETTQRLESLAHGQQTILDRLEQLEASLRRIEQGRQ